MNNNPTVPQLEAPSLSTPTLIVPKLYVPKLTPPNIEPGYRFKPSKPAKRKHVANLGDIIFNTKQRRNTIEDYNMQWIDNPFIKMTGLDKLALLYPLTKETLYEPIKEKKYWKALVNELQVLGDSLDVLANPIKGYVIESGILEGRFDREAARAGFSKGLGWYGDEYRKVYNYDTGNFLADLTLEIVSDPVNWATLGSKAAASSAAKAAATELETEVTKQAGKEAAEKISKRAYRTYAKLLAEASEEEREKAIKLIAEKLLQQQDDAAKALRKSLKTTKSLEKAIATHTVDYSELNELLNNKTFMNSLMSLNGSETFKRYSRALKALEISQGIDKGIEIASRTLAPVAGLRKIITKKLLMPSFRNLWNWARRKMSDFNVESYFDKNTAIKKLRGETIARTQKQIKKMLDKFSDENINYRRLVDEYQNIIRNTPAVRQTDEYLKEQFFKRLKDIFPVMFNGYNKTADFDDLYTTINVLNAEELQLLIDSVADTAYVLEQLEQNFEVIRQQALEADYKAYDQTVIDKLRQLDENIIWDATSKETGLRALPKYLDVLKQRDTKTYDAIMNLLTSIGLTEFNYKEVADLLYEGTPEAIANIKRLLHSGRTGEIYIGLKKVSKDALVIPRQFKALNKYNTTSITDTVKTLVDYATKYGDDVVYNSAEVIEHDAMQAIVNANRTQYLIKGVFYNIYGELPKNFTSIDIINAMKELDKLTDYPALEKTNVDYLKEVLSFNINEKMTSKELKEYTTALDELTRLSELWRQQFVGNESSQYFRKNAEDISFRLQEFVLDLFNVLHDEGFMKEKNVLKSSLSATDSYYGFLLSKFGMYQTVHTELGELSNPKVEKFIKDLSDPSSTMRQNLKSAVHALNESVLLDNNAIATSTGETIERICLTTDANNYLNTALDIVLDDTYSKEVQNYAKNLIYDMLYNNRNAFISQVDVSEIMNKYKAQLEQDLVIPIFEDAAKTLAVNANGVEKQTLDAYIECLKKIYHLQVEKNRGCCVNEDVLNNLFQELDFIRNSAIAEELEQVSLEMKQKIYERATFAITSYVTSMRSIAAEYTIPVRLLHLWDDGIVNYMNILGDNSIEILQTLAETEDLNINIEDVAHFIQHVSANAKANEINDFLAKYRDSLIQNTVLQVRINQLVEQASKNTNSPLNQIADEIEKTYSDIIEIKDNPLDTFNKQSNDTKKLINNLLKKRIQDFSDIPYTVDKNSTLAYKLTSAYTSINVLNNQLAGLADFSEYNVNRLGFENSIAIINAEAFNEKIYELTGFENAYGWSLANGFISVKKRFDANIIKEHHLSGLYIKAEGAEAELLYGYMSEYIKRASRWSKNYTGKYLDELRKVLMNWYSNFNTSNTYGPIDPIEYFGVLASDEDILAWDYLTRNINFLGADNVTKYCNEARKIDVSISNKYTEDLEALLDEQLNPLDYYKDLDDLQNAQGFTDTDKWVSTVNDIPIQILDDAYNAAIEDIQKPFKDVSQMKEHTLLHQKYIQSDRMYMENLRPLVQLTKAEDKRVKDVINTKQKRKIAESWGLQMAPKTTSKNGNIIVKEASTLNDKKVRTFHVTERAQALIRHNLNKWSPEQIRSFIDHNTPGALLIYDPYGTVNINKKWKSANLEIHKNISGLDDWIVIVRLDNNITNTPYQYEIPSYVFKDYQQTVTDTFKKNRVLFHTDTMDVPEELWTGSTLDPVTYQKIVDSELLNNILGAEKQKVYSNFDEKGYNKFFKKGTTVNNFTIIGDPSCVNRLLEATGVKGTYESYDIVKRTFNANLTAIRRQNNINKYLQLWFNDEYSLVSPMFRCLQNATDEELEDLFSNKYWDVCILKQDKQGLPKVYKIHVTNQKQLQQALKDKAIVLPHEVYRNAVLTVNKREVTDKVFSLYNNAVVGTYKTSYLGTVGFALRNAWDTLIYKNGSTSGGFFDIPKIIKYEYEAAKRLNEHNEIQKKVLQLAEERFGEAVFRKDILHEVLEEAVKNDPDVLIRYLTTEAFVNSSASGGLSKALAEYLLNYNTRNKKYQGYLLEKYWDDVVMDASWSPFKMINNINNRTEQMGRYGLFLKAVDEGLSPDSAIREVVRTHFDYELAKQELGLLEKFFWFSTFAINNAMYYMNGGLLDNPDMLKLQMDMLSCSWNTGDFTWDDIKNNRYLASQVARGNIRIKVNGKNFVIKIGSSVLDMYNLFFDPVESLKDRLNPFLAVPLQIRKANELTPFMTQIRNIKTIASGKSYVPSVYMPIAVYKKAKYLRKNYVPKLRGSSGAWTKIPRMKKVPKPPKRYYTYYGLYRKRYIFAQKRINYKWLTRTTGLAPYFINPISKAQTKDKRFRRMLSRMKLTI